MSAAASLSIAAGLQLCYIILLTDMVSRSSMLPTDAMPEHTVDPSSSNNTERQEACAQPSGQASQTRLFTAYLLAVAACLLAVALCATSVSLRQKGRAGLIADVAAAGAHNV